MSDIETNHRHALERQLQLSIDKVEALKTAPLRGEVSTMVGVGCMILAVIMLIGAPASIILTVSVVMGACIVGRHRDVCVELNTAKLVSERLAEDNRRKSMQISSLNQRQLEDARVNRELAQQVKYYRDEIHKQEESNRYG